MPHDLLLADGHDRDRSLGWLATAWVEALAVHGTGSIAGEPVVLTNDHTRFLVDTYAHSEAGKRLYQRAMLSRPKGGYKSGLAAFWSLFEALGPCRFAGFARGGEEYRDPWGFGFTYAYQPGEPMGRAVKNPFIRVLATEEGQTENTYGGIYFNLTQGPLAEIMPRNAAGLTRSLLPDGGEIRPSTSGAASKDGGNETAVVADEVHLYDTPELRQMFNTVDRNFTKRAADEPLALITTTWHRDGADSIGERLHRQAERIRDEREKGGPRKARQTLLMDHRFGVVDLEDFGNEKKLRKALRESYDDALEWNDIDVLVDKAFDPLTDPADFIRYYLNAPSVHADQWMAPSEWAGAGQGTPREGLTETEPIQDGDVIVLGFDGSEGRTDDKVADSTALVGCRVSDGALFVLGLWEQPPGLRAQGGGAKVWEPPRAEVDAAIAAAFDRFTVVGFWGDPAGWTSDFAAWAAKYGHRLKVKAGSSHPLAWWMTGRMSGRTATALTQFREAILTGAARHFDEARLSEHILNARMTGGRSGVQITKPESPRMVRKIDLAVAAVIAWQARLAAVAAGAGEREKPKERRSYTFGNMYKNRIR